MVVICSFCDKCFERSRGAIGKKYNFCNNKCYIEFINKNRSGSLAECLNCKKMVYRTSSQLNNKKGQTGFVFCSHSCSASYMNKNYEKLIISKKQPILRICVKCSTQYKTRKGFSTTKKCEKCYKEWQDAYAPYAKTLTLEQFKNRFPGKTNMQYNSKIRDLCRVWNKHLSELDCQKCGYSFYTEYCHIKPVSQFSPESLLSEINDESNIFILCPNHHKELDKGFLKPEDVPSRILIVFAPDGLEPSTPAL